MATAALDLVGDASEVVTRGARGVLAADCIIASLFWLMTRLFLLQHGTISRTDTHKTQSASLHPRQHSGAQEKVKKLTLDVQQRRVLR
jgi:hypothetical protein